MSTAPSVGHRGRQRDQHAREERRAARPRGEATERVSGAAQAEHAAITVSHGPTDHTDTPSARSARVIAWER
ncbi:MAG: hypothetical protein R3A48_16445 [Polyangiales bacterium]